MVAFVLGLTMLAADTLETDAKILEVSERGFVLSVGTEKMVVQDDSRTRFWASKKPAERSGFTAGLAVHVRLKTDVAPTLVREMSDAETAKWLNRIRHDVMSGTVKKVEPKRLHLVLDGGAEFSYAVSDTTKVVAEGSPSKLIDLTEGQRVFVKAQLQSNLDTKATEINTKSIAVKAAAKTSKKAEPKPVKLAPAGKITGIVQLPRIDFGLFDLTVKETLLHITFTPKTVITLMGKPTTARSIVTDMKATVTYQRDQYGRIIASKVELVGSNIK